MLQSVTVLSLDNHVKDCAGVHCPPNKAAGPTMKSHPNLQENQQAGTDVWGDVRVW